MIVQDVFNTKVVRFKCENTELYDNVNIRKNLEKVFHLAETNRPKDLVVGQEGVGKFETSMGGSMPIQMLPGLEGLMEWITQSILSAAPNYVNFTPSRFEISRSWANKIFLGCEGKAHKHGSGNSDKCVAIFYLRVPDNSSDLVFIEGDKVPQRTLDEYTDEKLSYANVKEGELLIHDDKILHAVTKHGSETPRICLVFEFKYVV